MVMLDTVAGADSPVHVYQEIDSIDQSVGKGPFRYNGQLVKLKISKNSKE